MKRFRDEELWKLRSELSIRRVIEELLRIPSKEIEGIFRFMCPKCREFRTAINSKVNLSRCFRCECNFNTIDLTMLDHSLSFVEAVRLLQNFNSGSFKQERLFNISQVWEALK